MKLYTCSAIKQLFDKYIDLGGEITTIDEGCLGYGITVMTAEGYKSCVVKEVYLNTQSSAHKIRFYNRLPKKYMEAVERIRG